MEVNKNKILHLFTEGKYEEINEILKNLVDNSCSELFWEWLSNHTAEEHEIFCKATELEELFFGDLKLIEFAEQLGSYEDATGNQHSDGLYDISESLCISQWRFVLVPDNGKWGACTYSWRRLIEITESNKNDDEVLLHEMIHAYEQMLSEYSNLEQYVLLRLYNRLKPKIDNLEDILNTDSHLLFQKHSPLFLLKSLDLDLNLGKPLGTIYSYGRQALFAPK